jgi:hypothetical protein
MAPMVIGKHATRETSEAELGAGNQRLAVDGVAYRLSESDVLKHALGGVEAKRVHVISGNPVHVEFRIAFHSRVL